METQKTIKTKFKDLFSKKRAEKKLDQVSNLLNLEHEDIIDRLCNEGRVHQGNHHNMKQLDIIEAELESDC